MDGKERETEERKGRKRRMRVKGSQLEIRGRYGRPLVHISGCTTADEASTC